MGSSTFTSLTSFAGVNSLATDTVSTIWNVAGDFLVVIVLFLILFLLAWQGGKAFIVSFLLSLYVGYALYVIFPYASYLPQTSPVVTLGISVLIFIILSAVAFFILHRAVASDFISISFIGLLLLALLATGFLLALAFHSFPVQAIYTFTPEISTLFAPNDYFFWWFAAPLVGLFFLVR